MATGSQGSTPEGEKNVYDTTQEYLKAALEHTIASGHSVRDFSEFALEKFGDASLPHIRHFFHEVRQGQVKIKGMARAAKKRIVGLHVSASEREEMIRLAAYVRAERRGFVGGSAQQDWCEAEREIDAQLEQEAGLVEKGHRALTSANTIVEQEYDHIKHVVSDWIDTRFGDSHQAHKGDSRKKGGDRKGTSALASSKNSNTKPKSPKATAKAAATKPAKQQAAPKKKESAIKPATSKKGAARKGKKGQQ